MLRKIKFLPVAICLFCANSAFACTAAELTKFGSTVHIPPSLFIKADKKTNRESSIDGTQCLRFFFTHTKKYAGELCASSSPDFLQDRGVVSYDSIPIYARSVEKPESGLMATSPLSQYTLEPFINKDFKNYAAIIDCDEVNDPIYRPTSSCHVAVAHFNSSQVLYSNFIIKSHINNKVKLSIEDIKKLWNSLKAKKPD